MASETVAVDFLGLGLGEKASEQSSESKRGTLVRPVPSVPEILDIGSGPRKSPILESAIVGDRANSYNRLRQGMHRPPWKKQMLAAKQQADMRSEEDNVSGSGKRAISPKRESTDCPPLGHSASLSAWDHLAPASPSPPTSSSIRYQELALTRMRAAMAYANGLQAPRQNTVSQTSSLGGEAPPRGAHLSERAGPEHLSVSIPPTQQQPPSTHSTGFGSPLSLYNSTKGSGGAENGVAMAATSSQKLQQMQHLIQGGSMQAHHTIARPTQAAGSGKHPRRAQLTIFYAGMVNVYDDVPFDKAQAIMLLAGSGNVGPTPPGSGAPPPMMRPFSTSMPMSQPNSTPPSSTPASPAPAQDAAIAAVGPLMRGLIANVLGQSVARPADVAELPQARKASLARFLEKRKDRVRIAPYHPPVVKREGSVTPPRGASPGPNCKLPTRSPSPASPLAGTQHRRLSPSAGPSGHQPCASSGSEEPNSPTAKHEKDRGSLGACGGGRSPCRTRAAVEDGAEAMHEDL